jgi:hypothetical protein
MDQQNMFSRIATNFFGMVLNHGKNKINNKFLSSMLRNFHT